MHGKVLALLEQIGLKFLSDGRSYRPRCSDTLIEAKMLKAQNIPGLVSLGRHDCGFTGHDWIVEQHADVVELLDLSFDPVKIVAAMPEVLGNFNALRKANSARPLVVASEYRHLANIFIEKWDLDAIFVQAYGATEALPPEDADIVIDNTSSGTTLHHNRLVVVDEIMQSSTRFICNKNVLADPAKRAKLEELTMLMKSTIQARSKVFLEMNVASEHFEQVVQGLPSMKAPTISQLYNCNGFAIKIAVDAEQVPSLIPKLLMLGARDILEYKVEKIINKVSL
jgi:ATP phosphoribosyltransferase